MVGALEVSIERAVEAVLAARYLVALGGAGIL